MNTKSSRMLASMNQHRPRQTKTYSHPPLQWLWQDPYPVLKHIRVSKLKVGLKITELICQLNKGIKNRGRSRWRTSDFLTTSLVSFLLYPVALSTANYIVKRDSFLLCPVSCILTYNPACIMR